MEEIKNGVTVIDADTLFVKDDYCTFYLHRPAPSEMTWRDAMCWANSKGWSLPDRWQGLTIARYRDEIVKHFGVLHDWWVWTCEEFKLLSDGACRGAYYVDTDYGYVGDNNKCSEAVVLAVSEDEARLLEVVRLERYPYNCKISDLPISSRTKNCLRAAEVITVGDLVGYTRKDIGIFRSLGHKSLNELDNVLEKLGLHWDMWHNPKRFY